MLDCEFSIPTNYLGDTPSTSTEIWAFSHFDCTSTILDAYSTSSATTTYWISKTATLGDIVVIGLLTLILFLSIGSWFVENLVPKRMNFKR